LKKKKPTGGEGRRGYSKKAQKKTKDPAKTKNGRPYVRAARLGSIANLGGKEGKWRKKEKEEKNI